jgi:AbrB family looped-hinge helix DNA binding protein
MVAEAPSKLSRIVRPLRGGQVTIPAEFRRKLGIGPDSLLEISLVDGELRIKPVSVATTVGGSPWVKELYDLFAPVRAEMAKYASEEIDAAIDEAIREVRQAHRKGA